MKEKWNRRRKGKKKGNRDGMKEKETCGEWEKDCAE
jgi:hypothetical protein